MRVDTGSLAAAQAATPPGQQAPAASSADAAAPHGASPGDAPTIPGATLAEMARTGPRLPGAAPAAPAPPRGSVEASRPSLAAELRGTGPRPLDLQMAQMANDVYGVYPSNGTEAQVQTGSQSEKDLLAAGWTRVQPGQALRTVEGSSFSLPPALLRDKTSGFEAAVYQGQHGELVVAFAGTNPSTLPDLVTDGAQGLGLPTRQYEQAASLAVWVADMAGADNVAFTGHSLGGGLAAHAVAATGAQGVTFNAAGPSNDSLREFGSPNDLRQAYENNGALRSYAVAGDPLTAASHLAAPRPLGTELVLPNTRPGASLVDLHGGGGDGQLYVAGMATQQAVPRGDHKLVQLGVEGRLQLALNSLGVATETGLGVVRDLREMGGEARADLHTLWQTPDAFTPLRVTGELADTALDAAGSVVNRLAAGTGQQVSVVTEQLGQGLRDLGEGTRLERAADAAGRGIETAGNALRRGAEGLGSAARQLFDRAGDVLTWTAGKLADGGSAVLNQARDLAHAAWDKLNPFKWSF